MEFYNERVDRWGPGATPVRQGGFPTNRGFRPNPFRMQSGIRKTNLPAPGTRVAARMSEAERDRHFRENLCFYCDKPGHQAKDCPTKARNTENSIPPKTNNPFRSQNSETNKAPFKKATGNQTYQTSMVRARYSQTRNEEDIYGNSEQEREFHYSDTQEDEKEDPETLRENYTEDF